jgi:UDP-3-O-[3-hydroxymyristoyl] glucosamine N-acyltransferase
LDNLVHVGHNCEIGEHSVIAAQAGLSGSCTFGKNVVVGGQAGFGEHCKLEDGAMVGGQTGVLPGKTIRGGEPVWGTPARSLEKFKEQFAWQSRLPELAARIKNLERDVRK